MRYCYLICFFVFTLGTLQAQIKLKINTDSIGVKISPTLYGIFFEDINHAADGGIYAELVSNRSFEDNASTPEKWELIQSNGAAGSMSLDTARKLNSKQSYHLKLQASTASAQSKVGVANSGFWGINIVNKRRYTLSFFARADAAFHGKITATLENNTGTIYASHVFSDVGSQWKKYTCELVASDSNPQGRIVLSIDAVGTLWLDVVSLFPPTFKNRPNGLRPDLAQLLVDLKPKFMRFPGGCFVEGEKMSNSFRWENTIGKIEERSGHYNLWKYQTTDGLGYHEFLQMAEDLGAEPLYVTNVGIAHTDIEPYYQIEPLIQNALDAIEYARGDVSTKYGAIRAANGHPAPFKLRYLEIGNENNQFNDGRSNHYAERYYAFYRAVKAKYPDIKCIGNVEAWGTDFPSWKVNHPVDLVDEHYYRDPQWFIKNADKYDSYSRKGPKVYIGEYAVTAGCGNGNLIAAIGEAAFMTGIERNADIVSMCSYAPIFVNVNDRLWNPDMIVFNSAESFGTPSYYVQKLFANNIGDYNLLVSEKMNVAHPQPITGNVGVGSWLTQVQYDSAVVTSANKTLFDDQFTTAEKWSPKSGTWTTNNGVYVQTAIADDCRSISSVSITDSSYTYTVKAMKTGGNEGFLIVFGYQDAKNFYWWNIGGWNNTQHAVERSVDGSKSILASAPGSIVLNKWYLIKVEVKHDAIYCYLDNVLISKIVNPSSKILYASASKKINSDEVILKVVNPGNSATSSTISLDNGKHNTVNGTVSVLSSKNTNDENSFSSPVSIVPVTSLIKNERPTFSWNFPAYSVSVFKLKLSKQ